MRAQPEAKSQRRLPDGEVSTRPEWWEEHVLPPVPPGYLEMVEQARAALDAFAGAVPDAATVAGITEDLHSLVERLSSFAVDENHQLAGRIDDAPGRGHLMVPPVRIDHLDEASIDCSVTFTRHFLGGHGAVHGGAVPMTFDDVLGRFSQSSGRPISRTAYLKVDYRSITPVDKPLRLRGQIVMEEGRKKLLRGQLHDGDTLCAEAEGLFVVLNPGQP